MKRTAITLLALFMMVTCQSKNKTRKFLGNENATPEQVAIRNQAIINKMLITLLSDVIETDKGELEKIEMLSLIRDLIDKQGAEVNAIDTSGDTPLIRAARNGHIRAMEILLEHKADVNAQANDGKTALILATRLNDLNMTKLLLEHRANPLLVDSDGLTARTGATRTDERAKTGDPEKDRRYREIMKLLRQAEKNQQGE